MKLGKSILFLALLIALGSAQNPVSSEPAFPTEGDSIVVFYDATLGDQGLMGYTGDIFTHIGIITNLSTSTTDWRYVAGGWSESVPRTKLESVGTDLYKLVIGYPRDYLGCPANEQILKIAFVFKNSDQSSTGRMADGSDIYLDIYDTAISAIFIYPQVNVAFGHPLRSPLFVGLGDTIDVLTTVVNQSSPLDSLTLFMNNVIIAADTTDTLGYQFIAAAHGTGPYEFRIKAQDSTGVVDSTAIVLMVNPVPVVAVPPAGAKPGINYVDYNTVTLALFAPYKDYIYAIGDFNDWKVDTTFFMHRHSNHADSTLWWITINGLSPGTEYAFQYLVDGEIRVADPYTAKILDPWNDSGQWGIPAETYPNLKPYPDGMTRAAVAVLETGQTPFNWVYSDTFQPPPAKDLVIYELLLRDFIERHDYQTLIDTLDYLDRLGINAVEFMPINEFEGNSSWGYNPSFYFAPDKYYGPADALKAVIDECHRRGMAVLIDMVLNHSYGQSPLVRLYWNNDLNRPAANNPWYNQVSPNPVYSWGYDFNHASGHTKAFVDRVNRYWIEEFKVDGFRFDFTKGFTNTPGDGSSYDAARKAILERMADQIWTTDSSAYIILEHFAPNNEERELADYGMLIWGNSNYNYNEATMGWHSSGGSDFSWGFYGTRGWSEPHLVTYMESHDEERLMYKNLQYGNSSGGYDIQNLVIAIERMKLAAGFFLTLPGPKMIWQFGERGYDVSINFGGRLGVKQPRWEYMQDPDRFRLYKTWQALLKLRRENEVFRSAATTVSLDLGRSDGLKKIRLSHSQMNVIILGNFGVTPQAITPNFYYTGTWYEYFSGDSAIVTGTSDPISLAPGELRIYTDQYLTPLEPGLLDADPLEIEVPTEFQLSQNYPNPFNPSTRIDFALPFAGKINLSIHDLLGREVVTLINNRQLAGWHSVTWNGRNQSGTPVSAGMYIYTLKTEQSTISKKLVLLK